METTCAHCHLAYARTVQDLEIVEPSKPHVCDGCLALQDPDAWLRVLKERRKRRGEDMRGEEVMEKSQRSQEGVMAQESVIGVMGERPRLKRPETLMDGIRGLVATRPQRITLLLLVIWVGVLVALTSGCGGDQLMGIQSIKRAQSGAQSGGGLAAPVSMEGGLQP